jgi:carbohydrate-selective porin OprB
MKSGISGFTAAALIAVLAAAAAPAASPPIRVTTAPLTATGTGDREKAFSLKLTTAALTATGIGGREEAFRPVVLRTDPLTATGLAKPASPIGGKK